MSKDHGDHPSVPNVLFTSMNTIKVKPMASDLKDIHLKNWYQNALTWTEKIDLREFIFNGILLLPLSYFEGWR